MQGLQNTQTPQPVWGGGIRPRQPAGRSCEGSSTQGKRLFGPLCEGTAQLSKGFGLGKMSRGITLQCSGMLSRPARRSQI